MPTKWATRTLLDRYIQEYAPVSQLFLWLSILPNVIVLVQCTPHFSSSESIQRTIVALLWFYVSYGVIPWTEFSCVKLFYPSLLWVLLLFIAYPQKLIPQYVSDSAWLTMNADTNPSVYRFEKSLYDLIKGLRNHKGAEEDYIQDSLRECKAEIKSQDTGMPFFLFLLNHIVVSGLMTVCWASIDKKATALLKVIYLEMFGYDMSWASFHVLEVMSSTNYLQKRVGYLGAMQSFRSDTEVLMLATNLLKKVSA